MLYIAVMTAIFSVAVAVHFKWLTAVRTLVFVDSFPFHYIKMGIPPFISAGIGAEAFLLSSVRLCNCFSAALAD